MTIDRTPGSVEAAVMEALHLLSPAECEAWTNRGPSYWYRVSNPGKPDRLQFADAAQLDAASLAKGGPARFRQLLGDLTMIELRRRGIEPGPVQLKDGLGHVVIEVGELASVLTRALDDGTVTDAERKTIAKEAQDVIDRATAIRDAALERVAK